jgi:hypothetical protein
MQPDQAVLVFSLEYNPNYGRNIVYSVKADLTKDEQVETARFKVSWTHASRWHVEVTEGATTCTIGTQPALTDHSVSFGANCINGYTWVQHSADARVLNNGVTVPQKTFELEGRISLLEDPDPTP